MMHYHHKGILLMLSVMTLLTDALPAASNYQPFALRPRAPGNRRQMAESSIVLGYWITPTITVSDFSAFGGAETHDLKMDIDDTGYFGFGFGFNINEFWTISAEFGGGSADYRADWGPNYIRGEMWMHTGKFNVDYHLLPGRFSPYVSAGLGYLYYDTGIPDGPPEYWWDEWWGYTVYQSTYAETVFTLNAGGGLRWDVTDSLSVKAHGTYMWTDIGRGAGWPGFIFAGATVSFRF